MTDLTSMLKICIITFPVTNRARGSSLESAQKRHLIVYAGVLSSTVMQAFSGQTLLATDWTVGCMDCALAGILRVSGVPSDGQGASCSPVG